MAQSALTVTAPNPTPPTNMSFTGATPPNPPNYTKATYTDYADNTKFDSAPPPYFDDGTAGAVGTFATNTAALASGTGATGGGTEGTYPGTGSVAGSNFLGAVPASTSVAHEAAGTETSVTNPGNITHTYVVGTMDTSKAYGVGPALTAASVAAGPNASHASTLSPTTAPTLTSIASIASGAGNGSAVCTGTGFNKQSVVYVSGIPYTTTFTSATSITGLNVPKRATAGTLPVNVVTGGAITTATVNWTFT
jgi:hypothetical protein